MQTLILWLALFALILASCAPVQVTTSLSSATVTTTSTPPPTATPTVTPTVTPTPTPENIGDAKDLPEWIDNYVHAYGGKITVNGMEMDANKLTDEIRKNGDAFIKVKPINEIEYFFLIVNDVPLAFRQSGDFKWQKVTLGNPGQLFGITVGTERDARDVQRAVSDTEFNAVRCVYGTEWNNIQPSNKDEFIFENPSAWAFADECINWASKNEKYIMSQLVYAVTYPAWLKSFSTKDELKQAVTNYIIIVVGRYKGKVNAWQVLSEYFPVGWKIRPDILQEKIGYEELLKLVFTTAQNADPSAAMLLVNDFNGNKTGLYGTNYDLTLRQLDILKQTGIRNLEVGMEMHLDASKSIPSEKEIIETMQSYGVPVVVTEMDVDIRGLQRTDRYQVQAEIYGRVMRACIKSGVCKHFYTFQVGDQYSWLEVQGDSEKPDKNADPTLFDDGLKPKPAYFAVLEVLFKYAH